LYSAYEKAASKSKNKFCSKSDFATNNLVHALKEAELKTLNDDKNLSFEKDDFILNNIVKEENKSSPSF